MKWKKLVSMLIVAVFVISALAVLTSPASAQTGGQYVQTISLEVRTSQNTGLGDTAKGDIDVFMQTVEGKKFEGISDDWKSELGTWRSVGSYNNQLLNPAYNKTYDIPATQVGGEWQFNPFGDQEIRFAVNFLLDRQLIAEDMYSGYASERYCAIGQEDPGYEEYFAPVVEDLGLTPTGDFEQGYNMIQDRMNHWANNQTILDVTGAQPELQDSGSDASASNLWTFDGSPIEIISLNRIEDTRLQIGHYFTDQLDKCGFETIDRDQDRNKAISTAFYSDPKDQEFHSYTGGWIASSASKYQHVALNQMYCGWYTWMPGFAGWGGRWSYYGPDEMEDKGYDIANGRVPDLETYWQYMQDVCEFGIEESVRVFITSTFDFYPYDKDRVVTAATDVVTGWSSMFSIRTMKVNDANGATKLAQYSSTGALYMDNWNRIDGSGDVYGSNQQDMVRDYSVALNPATGEPISMRADYTVEKGYQWDEGSLTQNISVPSDAIIYNATANEWQEVGSGIQSAVKVTFDWEENDNGDLGTFHDGNPITEQDILAWHAFSKEICYDDGEGYFHAAWSSTGKPFFDAIYGIEWGENDGTYTVYGDYTFPVDSQVAYYYSETPWKPWQVNEAARIMVNAGDETALRSGAPHEGETFSWSDDPNSNWVHFISAKQCQDFAYVMEQMQANDFVPVYLSDASNCPFPITASEVSSRVDNTLSFYDDFGHLFVSQGPFRITNVDEPNMLMEMERWGQDDGYPLPNDYWADKLKVIQFELGTVTMPSLVQAGEEFTIDVNARIREEYPLKRVYDADEGTVTFELWDGTTKVGEVEGTYVEPGLFEVTVPGSMTEGLDGSYNVQISGIVEGAITPSTTSKSLLVIGGEGGVEVSSLNADPTEGPSPLDVTVTASLSNTGDSSGSVDVMVDGTTMETVTVAAGETRDYTGIFTLDSEGDHTIEIGGQSVTVTVTEAVAGVEVSNFEVSPTSGEAPLEVSITADLENTGDSSVDVSVMAGGEEVTTVTVDAGSTAQVDETYTFDSAGDYVVQVHNSKKLVSVSAPAGDGDGDGTDGEDGEDGEDDDGIPGFTFALLGIAAIFAILLYRKKNLEH